VWVAERDERVALVGWTRDSRHSEPFFFPLGSRATLIWQVATLPEFRGRGLYHRALERMQQVLFEEGVDEIFITCADYNRPSIKGIKKAGFSRIGRGRINRKGETFAYFPDHPCK